MPCQNHEKQLTRLHERRVELQHDLQGDEPIKVLCSRYNVQHRVMSEHCTRSYGPAYLLERKRRLLRQAQARQATKPPVTEDRQLLPPGALSEYDLAKVAEYRGRGKTWIYVVRALNLVEAKRYLAAYAAFWGMGELAR